MLGYPLLMKRSIITILTETRFPCQLKQAVPARGVTYGQELTALGSYRPM
jgi:hypothetical protein